MPKRDRLTRIIDDLIGKSEAATLGPWEKSALVIGYIVSCEKGSHKIIASVAEYAPDGSIAGIFDNAQNNANYIAACDPETIREICKALGRARSDIAVHESTIAGLEAKIEEQQKEHARLEKEADWLACAIICACQIGRQCDFGLGCKCKNCAENKSPADWRKAAREAVAAPAPDPSTMPLRGERVAWTSKDKA